MKSVLLAGCFGLMLAATPATADEVKVTCDFIEVSAAKGTAGPASIDAALKPIEKKLKKAPFATQWKVFKLLSQTQKTLARKKPEAIALKQGAATATLIETVDSTKVRLTVSIEDAKGKQAINQTSTLAAGDYIIHTEVLPNDDGHLVAVTCK